MVSTRKSRRGGMRMYWQRLVPPPAPRLSDVGIIYGLTDPLNGQIRYVGRTIQDPEIRLRGHRAGRGGKEITKWIRSLEESGNRPNVIVIEDNLTPGECDVAENFWITYFKFIGASLANMNNAVVLCPRR